MPSVSHHSGLRQMTAREAGQSSGLMASAQEVAGLLPEGGLAAVATIVEHGLRMHLVAGALTAETEASMRRLHGNLRAAAAAAS